MIFPGTSIAEFVLEDWLLYQYHCR